MQQATPRGLVGIAGVDLAACKNRPTGLAVVHCGIGGCRLTRLLSGRLSDEDIVRIISGEHAEIAVFDAPLSLPESGGFRRVERKFMRIGGKLLPLTMRSMRLLAERAMRLAERLRSIGVEVYETHPRSVLRICSASSPAEIAERLGVEGVKLRLARMDRHEADALTAALVGVCIYKACVTYVKDVDGVIAYIPNELCKE